MTVQVNVIDNGERLKVLCGHRDCMDDTIAEKMFDPFFHVEVVGLVLDYQLYACCSRDDGSISVVSQVGEGTTLNVDLPMRK